MQIFKSTKMVVAIAKHSVMGGIYHEIGTPGMAGVAIEVPLRDIRAGDPLWGSATTRPWTIYELDPIYRENKNLLIASIPIPAQQVHGLGFYDCRPSMGIFAIADSGFKPFLTSPIFNRLAFTDEAGIMIEWLNQNGQSMTAYPFATVPRLTEAWCPMLAFFRRLALIYGEPENQRGYHLKNDNGKINATAVHVDNLSANYQP